MQRRLSAIRDVLLHIEKEIPFTGDQQQLNMADIASDCDEEEVSYAVYLLLDCGYLDGVWDPSPVKQTGSLVRAITNSGHEFLELARDERLWAEVASAVPELNSLNMEVLENIAKALVEQRAASLLGVEIA